MSIETDTLLDKMETYVDGYYGDVAESVLLDIKAAIHMLEAEIKRLSEAPIQIQVKGDQVWIAFDAGEGRHAMLNLNEIVRNKPDFGITKGICLDAMRNALEGVNRNALRYEADKHLELAAIDEYERVLRSAGFERCDIPDCNCNSWHQVGGFYARFKEIEEVLEPRNGETLLAAAIRYKALEEK